MNFLRLLPAILSLLLLGAHFSRAGLSWLAPVFVLLPLLLFLKKPWVPRLMQVVLVLGSLEWVRSTLVYVGQRREIGDSWGRLAAILGAVALFTLLSAWILSRSVALRKRYRLE